MRTSSPSTTSITQQSMNALVSFTKVLEILRKPSAENLFYAEVHPRLEPKGQILRKPSAENLFYAEVHPRLEPKGQKSQKFQTTINNEQLTIQVGHFFREFSLLFVKQTESVHTLLNKCCIDRKACFYSVAVVRQQEACKADSLCFRSWRERYARQFS